MRRFIWSARPSAVLIAALVGVVTASACQSNKPDAPPRQRAGGSQDGQLDPSATVSYDGEIADLLDDNCVSCHDGGDKANDPDLSSYVRAKRAAKGILAQVKAEAMPPTEPLSKKQIALINSWVKAGMPKSAPDDDDDDDDQDDDDDDDDDDDGGSVSLSFSYDGWLKGYMDTNCNTCHAPGKTYPDLSTYEYASTRSASILNEVEAGRMPPAPGTPMAPGAIEKLKRWIAEGKPRADAAGGAALTYDTGIKAWVDQYCISCHGAGQTLPDLSTKANVQASADSMYASVLAKRMPKFAPIASDTEVNKLRDWIAGGKK